MYPVFVFHKGFEADIDALGNKPTQPSEQKPHFLFFGNPGPCQTYAKCMKNQRMSQQRGMLYIFHSQRGWTLPHLTRPSRDTSEKTQSARGNSCQWSMSVLIPQECALAMDVTAMTAEPARPKQSYWCHYCFFFLFVHGKRPVCFHSSRSAIYNLQKTKCCKSTCLLIVIFISVITESSQEDLPFVHKETSKQSEINILS